MVAIGVKVVVMMEVITRVLACKAYIVLNLVIVEVIVVLGMVIIQEHALEINGFGI
jgi:hypothetical protein